ncbi:nucleotide exchange factor GrpE, partial [Streptomyces asiaticus]
MSTQPQQPDPVPEGAVTEPEPEEEQGLPAPGAAEARGVGGEGPGPDAAGGPAIGEADERAAEQAAALAELEDKWRRALADLENLRKRHARELERERAAERARTAVALLPVVDNLELALSHAEADPGSIVEGVKAIRDQAVDSLARLGYEREAETGVPFDPARHEVVGVVEDAEAEPGTVVQVL